MAAGVSGEVTYHLYTDEKGLREETRHFDSLDELFDLLLDTADEPERRRVNRVHLNGADDAGEARTVTLLYQSLIARE